MRNSALPSHYRYVHFDHISDHDAERYYLGMLTDARELACLEEHLLWCHPCLDLVMEAQDYVDAMRVGLLEVNGR